MKERRRLLNVYFTLLFFFITSICVVVNGISSQTGGVLAQSVAINISATVPDASAILDISSTTSGFLLPRMTSAERNTIPAPATGLIIYNTTTSYFNVYTPTGWYELISTGCLGSVTGTVAPGKGVAINTIAAIADSAAICDVKSTIKGVLIPRTRTDSISTPATGLMIYDTTINALSYYNGSSWINPCSQFTTATTGGSTPLSGSLGVAINTSAAIPDPSAILDVSSRTKGLLVPRMTGANRDSLKAVTGLTVYNTNTNLLNYWSGTEWLELSSCSAFTGNSLRFNDDDNAYLNRTFSTGNRKTWTFSAWIKRSNLTTGTRYVLFGTGENSASSGAFFGFDVASGSRQYAFDLNDFNAGSYFRSVALFRDPAAWMHIMVVVNTTLATANQRIRVYVNGVELTVNDGSAGFVAQNTDMSWNTAQSHAIGVAVNPSGVPYSGYYFDGFMSDVYFIDGQALTPSSFGQTNTTTGEWESKAYTGAYGTNGFHLDFADSSPASDLGKDISGNTNNFTINNLDATDQVIDASANNFATLNLFDKSAAVTLSNGSLQATGGTSGGNNTFSQTAMTFGLPTSGKWYFEMQPQTAGIDSHTFGFNVTKQRRGDNGWPATRNNDGYPGYYNFEYGMWLSGNQASDALIYRNNWIVNNTNTTVASNVVTNNYAAQYGVAINCDNNTFAMYRNGVLIGTYQAFVHPGPDATVSVMKSDYTMIVNFGQGGQSGLTYYPSAGGYFKYAPPCGYKAFNTQNLPAPAIAQGNSHFAPLLYTGNGTSQSVTGLNFQPDLVWIKNRTVARSHQLYDSQRGVQKWLASNLTQAEVTSSTYLTAFNSNGFSVGSDEGVNESGSNMMSWSWKESATSGFDIVTWAGNGSPQNLSHNLGTVPAMMIVKNRNTATNNEWFVYHKNLHSSPATARIQLNQTSAVFVGTSVWNSTAPTSSVFTAGSDVSENGSNYVAYLFSEIEGFSKFGSYTGTASDDGPFIYTGFKPCFIMIKRTDAVNNWVIHNTLSDPNNPVINFLLADNTQVESTSSGAPGLIDILSNGFKIRKGNQNYMNASGGTYIYIAFAKAPFKYANAK